MKLKFVIFFVLCISTFRPVLSLSDFVVGGTRLLGGAAKTTRDVTGGLVNVGTSVAGGAIGAGGSVVEGGKAVAEGVTNTVSDIVRPAEVCFNDLGCFTSEAPWFSILRPLPAPYGPDVVDVRFYLYTRKQPQRFDLSVSSTEFDAAGSDFVGSKQTYFITHGFASNGNSSWLSEMKDAILKRYDGNVILVDWGKGASFLNYFQVASNTRVAAAVMTKLGNYLINRWGADPSRFNLIGHSLGAHISAYAAKNIGDVAKLYALDPAQPAFEGVDKAVRLDKSDADFVQVIHTSARPFIPFIGLGMIDPQGHVDFYVNGGWNQPGCILPPKPNITSFLDLATVPVEVISNFISCPHGRSYEFFTASINNPKCRFWGHRASPAAILESLLSAGYLAKLTIPKDDCDDAEKCSPLGFDALDFPARGVFDVATTSNKPYCVAEPLVEQKMRQFRSF